MQNSHVASLILILVAITGCTQKQIADQDGLATKKNEEQQQRIEELEKQVESLQDKKNNTEPSKQIVLENGDAVQPEIKFDYEAHEKQREAEQKEWNEWFYVTMVMRSVLAARESFFDSTKKIKAPEEYRNCLRSFHLDLLKKEPEPKLKDVLAQYQKLASAVQKAADLADRTPITDFEESALSRYGIGAQK